MVNRKYDQCGCGEVLITVGVMNTNTGTIADQLRTL